MWRKRKKFYQDKIKEKQNKKGESCCFRAEAICLTVGILRSTFAKLISCSVTRLMLAFYAAMRAMRVRIRLW
jgi:uncharacterized membrane protein